MAGNGVIDPGADSRSLPLVVVVGGGPAGCAAARSSVRAGVAAMICERGAPGKDKVCGDGYVASAVELLSDLGVGVTDIGLSGGRRFARMELRSGGKTVWHFGASGWVARRAEVDQRLRDATAAFVAIRYRTKVIDATHDGKRWHVLFEQDGARSEVLCDGVVLACGVSDLGAGTLSGHPIIAASISAYVPERAPEEPWFEFTEPTRPGYAWQFPLADGWANIGVCSLARRQDLKRVAQAYVEGSGKPPARLRGGAGPLWSGSGRRWHDPRGMASCGDAAGLVDPVSGEGITAALQSGQRCGVAVAYFLQDGRDPRHLREYSAWLAEHYGQEYGRTPLRRIWANLCGM
jgi:menaquinone-9 beta-reductase